jgi:glycosyltransferase involved in cell wall biosynthesis
MPGLSFSIVINTYNRAASLAVTLDSLRFLNHRRFEVVVVNGPSTDESPQLLGQWKDRVKVGSCPVANLSVSRNIGIAMSGGDVVAFIDDDAVPEPEWLDRLEAGYSSGNVGAVGGMVFDHTGYVFQAKYILCNRMGDARHDFANNPSDRYNFPGSNWYCSLIGTNSSFRRSALLEIGGFDEEFEYYLDETDVCLRVVDAGYQVRFVDDAFVHHRFLPSHIRNEKRALKHWSPIIKNKFYFTNKHAYRNHTAQEIAAHLSDFHAGIVNEWKSCMGEGPSSAGKYEAFLRDFERDAAVGTERARAAAPSMLAESTLARHAAPFRAFGPTYDPARKLRICFLSQDYPPRLSGGIARFTADLARALADRGHDVHVLTRGEGHSTVDYEQGAWVHRIVVAEMPRTRAADELAVPAGIWNHSATMLRELERIASHRAIDVVEAPIWDAEGIAILLDRRFPLVTSLQTTMKIALETHPEWTRDPAFARNFLGPMFGIESALFRESAAIHSISRDIARTVESQYGVKLREETTAIIPLGLSPRQAVPADLPGELRLLFVGRLERRKGIDVLLAIAPRLLERHPKLVLCLVGDDTLGDGEGSTFRRRFEAAFKDHPAAGRVHFEGKATDERLYSCFAGCDIFVAPSRYESFGLIFLEAMMFGKPVVGCRAGGMPEIIANGETGLLAEPGDEESLLRCLDRLAADADLRERLGRRGREVYEAKFTAQAAAAATEAFLRKFSRAGKERP